MSKELPKGAYIINAQMHLKWKGEEMRMSIDDFALKGKHNQYNGMAASMAATAVDIKKENIRESLQTFESLEHRMEPVATIKGVSFINDSKATNINSTWFALESMERPTIRAPKSLPRLLPLFPWIISTQPFRWVSAGIYHRKGREDTSWAPSLSGQGARD